VQRRLVAGQAAHSALAQISDGGHAVPQAPQFSWLTCRFTHALPHAVRGAGQMHAPPTQVSPAAQTWPQVPQCFGFVSGSMHVPSQTRSLAGQGAQALCAQTSAGLQAASHAPQLSWLLERFTQSAVHWVRGSKQRHTLSMHDWPEGQA
jgi:hypothetical protein